MSGSARARGCNSPAPLTRELTRPKRGHSVPPWSFSRLERTFTTRNLRDLRFTLSVPPIRAVMELSKLFTVFEVGEDEASAVKSFAS